jgi:hypothetical protein
MRVLESAGKEAKMPHISKQMLIDAADAMPRQFDTHDLIEALQRSNPQEYVRDLYRFVHHADPFTSLHAEIGRRLLGVISLEKIRKVRGRNVRGRISASQQWHQD